MPFAFFQVPSDASAEVAAPLNAFLRSHRIVRVIRQWCEAGKESAWAFCVEYLDGPGVPGMGGLPAKVDYREVLPPEQFEVFARLRTLRKALSEREGQPVFAIFTNAQLAEIVQRECRTVEDLRAIAGIGEARAAKYGAEVLAVMAPAGGTP
jgi:superfamily II DNA helicase RecQ